MPMRGADDVFASAGVERVESEAGKDEPRAHLSAVVVAHKAVGFVQVVFVADFTHDFRRAVTTPHVREEVGHMVTRLVAVRPRMTAFRGTPFLLAKAFLHSTKAHFLYASTSAETSPVNGRSATSWKSGQPVPERCVCENPITVL